MDVSAPSAAEPGRATRFLARVGGLTGASILSQVIGALSLMVLTRTLSSADVGVYQVFLSRGAIIGSVALLAYPTVIPHLDARLYETLVVALLVLLALVSAASAAVCLALHTPFALWIGIQVLAAGLTSLAEMSNIRGQRVRWIAVARVAFSVVSFLWFLGLRLTGTMTLGMVVRGQVVAALVVAAVYGAASLRGALVRVPRAREIWDVVLAKKNCVLYVTPSELLGSLTFNLPTMLIDRFFGPSLAGSYGVVLRLCGAPVNILASTIGQVYHGSLAQSVRERRPEALAEFFRLRRALAGLGALTGVSVFLLVPIALRLFLGPGWDDTHAIARILSPMYAAMIFVSPLAVASFQVFEAQRAIFLLQLASAAISFASFALAGVAHSFWLGVVIYAVLVTGRYMVFLLQVSRLSRERLAPLGAAALSESAAS